MEPKCRDPKVFGHHGPQTKKTICPSSIDQLESSFNEDQSIEHVVKTIELTSFEQFYMSSM